MVILYIYSTCYHMKSVFYERQHPAARRPPCVKETEPYTNKKAETSIMTKKQVQGSTGTG
jgi:hypothetical protein